VVFVLGVFMLTFLIGFVFPIFFVDEIIGFINELIASLEGLSAVELIGVIFWNNLKASFFAIILGITFGILPLVILVTNGYLLGFVSRLAVNERGLLVMWQLLPHGIFELPAIILSIGIGFKIGLSTIQFIVDFINKHKKKINVIILILLVVIFPVIFLIVALIIEWGGVLLKDLKYNFVEGLRFFVFVILPLLLVAAVIEGILIGLVG
jgi:stage II sporulation protein M